MAQKTLTTSYLAKLSNANHDGVTQQIDDRLQGLRHRERAQRHPAQRGPTYRAGEHRYTPSVATY